MDKGEETKKHHVDMNILMDFIVVEKRFSVSELILSGFAFRPARKILRQMGPSAHFSSGFTEVRCAQDYMQRTASRSCHLQQAKHNQHGHGSNNIA